MSAFRIDYRRRGARKWLADPRRRFFTERATADEVAIGAARLALPSA